MVAGRSRTRRLRLARRDLFALVGLPPPSRCSWLRHQLDGHLIMSKHQPLRYDDQSVRNDAELPIIEADDYGADVLDDVAAFLRRFVASPNRHALVAHTLWIAHTHLMAAWDSTPRLAFLSPEPGSGKTRALEVSELLVANAVVNVNMTPAYLFRRINS